MQVIRHLDELPREARGGAVAIGNFDGVHLGHAQLVRMLADSAREIDGPAVVFTFDPHPVRILRPERCPPPLTWTARKAELLAELGVDWVIAYPTDEALLRLSAREFFQRIVINSLDARAMVEGPNFFFGHNREGTTDVLRALTEEAGVSLTIAPGMEAEGGMVSSSRIRELIGAKGDLEVARRMLTAPYRVRGIVTHGAGRGVKLGFPTANVEGIDTLLPARGVYGGLAVLGHERLPAAINVGPSPTFGDTATKVEVHVIDHDEPLYGKPLEVDFLVRLREIRPFASAGELVTQLREDVRRAGEAAREYLQRDRGA